MPVLGVFALLAIVAFLNAAKTNKSIPNRFLAWVMPSRAALFLLDVPMSDVQRIAQAILIRQCDADAAVAQLVGDYATNAYGCAEGRNACPGDPEWVRQLQRLVTSGHLSLADWRRCLQSTVRVSDVHEQLSGPGSLSVLKVVCTSAQLPEFGSCFLRARIDRGGVSQTNRTEEGCEWTEVVLRSVTELAIPLPSTSSAEDPRSLQLQLVDPLTHRSVASWHVQFPSNGSLRHAAGTSATAPLESLPSQPQATLLDAHRSPFELRINEPLSDGIQRRISIDDAALTAHADCDRIHLELLLSIPHCYGVNVYLEGAEGSSFCGNYGIIGVTEFSINHVVRRTDYSLFNIVIVPVTGESRAQISGNIDPIVINCVDSIHARHDP